MDTSTVIDGFRITNGYANYGGGLYLNNSSPSLINIVINSNTAGSEGGGVYCDNSQASFDSVIIDGNISFEGLNGGYGGGMYLKYSNIIFLNGKISNNLGSGGGGVYLSNSSPTFENTLIENNNGMAYGGGIYCHNYSSPILYKLIIKDNIANAGGGIKCSGNSYPILTNVEIIGNYAYGRGGGANFQHSLNSPSSFNLVNVTISDNSTQQDLEGSEESMGGGGIWNVDGELNLINCIIWNNFPQQIESKGDASSINISHSDIGGLFDQTGIVINDDGILFLDGLTNFGTDPLFNGDFTLQDGSPCIDAGTAYLEWEGEIIVDIPHNSYYGQAPDMGVYEWYPEDPEYELGDFNADGSINVLDVVALVANILSAGEYNPAGDLMEDGVLNVLDIVALVNIILGGG